MAPNSIDNIECGDDFPTPDGVQVQKVTELSLKFAETTYHPDYDLASEQA